MDGKKITENGEQDIDIVEKVLGKEVKAELGWMERLTGIFFSPGKTFKDIAKKHDWGLIPLIIMIIVGLAANGVFLMTHDIGEMVITQLEDSGEMGNIPEEQLDTVMKISGISTKIAMVVGSVVAPPAVAAIIAFIFLIIFKLSGSENTFGQTFTVVCYSWFIYTIKSALFLVLLLFKRVRTLDELAYFVKSNVAAFVNSEAISKPLLALLASIDVFTIWVLVLMSVGLAAITKKSPYMTGAIVFTLWLIVVVVKVGLAFLQTMAG